MQCFLIPAAVFSQLRPMKCMRYDRFDGGTRFRRSILLFLLISLIPMFGCSVTIPMARPTPSNFQYSIRKEVPVTIVVKDSRPDSERNLAKGRLTVHITGVGEGLTFLGEEVAKELKAKGINAAASASDAAGPDSLVLDVDRFYIRHHRATGYSPWVTFTNFRAKAVFRERSGA